MPKNPNPPRDPATGVFVSTNAAAEEPETLPEELQKDLLATRNSLYGANPREALLAAYKRNFLRATFFVEYLGGQAMVDDALKPTSRPARRRLKELQVWLDRQTRLAEKILDLEAAIAKRN